MYYSKNIGNKINELITFVIVRLAQNNICSLFEELLSQDKSDSIHHENIQELTTKNYKVKNGTASDIKVSFFLNIKIPKTEKY